MNAPHGTTPRRKVWRCQRCGHRWMRLSGRTDPPIRCANRACGTPYCATPRKEPHTSPR